MVQTPVVRFRVIHPSRPTAGTVTKSSHEFSGTWTLCSITVAPTRSGHMRYSQSKGLLKGVYILFMLKGGNMLRGVAGVSRGPIPEGRLDENGSHYHCHVPYAP